MQNLQSDPWKLTWKSSGPSKCLQTQIHQKTFKFFTLNVTKSRIEQKMITVPTSHNSTEKSILGRIKRFFGA